MTKSKEKLKPKFLITANKQTKLSIQISQKLSDLIDDYRTFHKEFSGEEVTLDALISAVISSALVSDKSFVKWRRDKSGTSEQEANSEDS
jgi:hypothetical protein